MSNDNFKINIHDTLLQKLSDENDYIDLADLVTKISRTLAFLYLHFLLCNIHDCKLNFISFSPVLLVRCSPRLAFVNCGQGIFFIHKILK